MTDVASSNPTLGAEQPGLLLIGHGTRDPRGVSEFLVLADLVDKRLPNVAVRACFLELAEPTINEAITSLVASGIDSLVVAPVLLLAAGHAKQDIPRAIAEALNACPEIPYAHALHLGTHQQLIALSAQRFQQATSRLVPMPAEETMLLLVGRGSRDAEATHEMLTFSEMRQSHCGLANVATAFYAMADPGLGEALEDLQHRPYRRIVVQPHLLFCGQILDQIVRMVDEVNRKASHQEWIICEHLGPSPSIAEVLTDRFAQTLTRQAP